MKYLSIVKKITFLISLFFLFPALNAQINMEDSTVQVIGYWDKNEKQSYQIQEKKATVSTKTPHHLRNSATKSMYR